MMKAKRQDYLTLLGGIYAGRSIRRDAFGRRMALPSEIARALGADPNRAPHPAPLSDHPAQRSSSLPLPQLDLDEGPKNETTPE
jgi:hypothetical protein